MKLERVRVISRSIHELLVDFAKFAAEGLDGEMVIMVRAFGEQTTYACQLLSTTMGVTMIITSSSASQVQVGCLHKARDLGELTFPGGSLPILGFVLSPFFLETSSCQQITRNSHGLRNLTLYQLFYQ